MAVRSKCLAWKWTFGSLVRKIGRSSLGFARRVQAVDVILCKIVYRTSISTDCSVGEECLFGWSGNFFMHLVMDR